MIVAASPNPSVDRAVIVPDFSLGKIHRPESVLSQAGGKGLNVARAIYRLGGVVKACAILAGYNGRWIADQLDLEGIDHVICWTEGETRISTSIIDPKRHKLTEIYETNKPINHAAWEEYERVFAGCLNEASWITFSGSLPVGAPMDGFERLTRIARKAGLRCALDTRDVYLENGLIAKPAIVKVNASEAAGLTGQPVENFGQALQAAAILRQRGAGSAIITLGGRGAVASSHQGDWIGRAPRIKAIAPVGSGDSFLGGLVLALSHSETLPEALRLAIAAGAANAQTVGVARIDPQSVASLAAQVSIRQV